MALERKEIVGAALDLLQEVGIDKLSTRALATRLGVAQPALYWHFKSKADLLDAINEEMLTRYHERRLPRLGETWEEFTVANARSMRRALLSVRDGARISAGTRPTTTQFGDAESQLRLYVDAGFNEDQALHIAIGITRYIVGFVLEEQGERERADEGENVPPDIEDELAKFPILSKAVVSLVNEGTINTESVFEGGLNFFMEGMRVTLSRRQG
jgi:TetR/AcrR family tetracycline transcriptional repressor